MKIVLVLVVVIVAVAVQVQGAPCNKSKTKKNDDDDKKPPSPSFRAIAKNWKHHNRGDKNEKTDIKIDTINLNVQASDVAKALKGKNFNLDIVTKLLGSLGNKRQIDTTVDITTQDNINVRRNAFNFRVYNTDSIKTMSWNDQLRYRFCILRNNNIPDDDWNKYLSQYKKITTSFAVKHSAFDVDTLSDLRKWMDVCGGAQITDDVFKGCVNDIYTNLSVKVTDTDRSNINLIQQGGVVTKTTTTSTSTVTSAPIIVQPAVTTTTVVEETHEHTVTPAVSSEVVATTTESTHTSSDSSSITSA